MLKGNKDQQREQSESAGNNNKKLDNILRTLTMLEKSLDRLVRSNYYNRDQYPPIVFEIEDSLNTIRSCIEEYKIYADLSSFSMQLGIALKEIGHLITQLIDLCRPLPGKKQINKKQRIHKQINLCRSIDAMLKHIASYIDESKNKAGTSIGIAFEKALQEAFKEYFSQKHERRVKMLVSGRGEKTYIFPWSDKEGYIQLVQDPEKFRVEVVEKLGEYTHATGHKPSCKGCKEYKLTGFRQNNRKPIMVGGQKVEFPVRMIQCKGCGQKFSLLPSFLPREKHFCIDIIGHVFQNMLLFAHSIQAAIENLKMIEKGVKSKQTILNWLRWMGTLHPATILTRAGIAGTGYFQEDEGFEKEPDLRTYTVFMVEPTTFLIWHVDYVDHVDEESLCESFENFLKRVTFKILGVTKDKWEASTKALKAVFKNIWIGFCHRHCLKKFREVLLKYQEETKCSKKDVDRLYKKFKKVLETSTSSVSLEVKLKSLDDAEFNHPLLKERLAELKKNATHYTCYKSRKGITKTTSIVDNILKIVKRKLTMVESFRDKECTQLLFRALANTRNFVPFLSGAKNAHKSPFMLAQGQTHELPWIQVMNFHNAFLFTADAF